MGYQESMLQTKEAKRNFEVQLNTYNQLGETYYEDIGNQQEIITFTDNKSLHPKLKKG